MRVPVVIVAVVSALALAGCSAAGERVTDPTAGARSVSQLYPTAPNGMEWYSGWGEGATGDVLGDPWVQEGSHDIRYELKDGVLSITGETSRLYVRNPALKYEWHDVEVTVYAKRIADDGVPYSGIVSAVRLNHGVTGSLESNPCDSRGLSARLRFDGGADFGKETAHPTTIATKPIQVFPDGLPYNQWIGYKHVVYDIEDSSGVAGTRQELWVNLTGGKSDGEWQLVATHDDFPYSGFGQVACAPGIDPTIAYVNGPRAGSESGLPSIAVLFRADGIWKDGLQYKWASVREITAPNQRK